MCHFCKKFLNESANCFASLASCLSGVAWQIIHQDGFKQSKAQTTQAMVNKKDILEITDKAIK